MRSSCSKVRAPVYSRAFPSADALIQPTRSSSLRSDGTRAFRPRRRHAIAAVLALFVMLPVGYVLQFVTITSNGGLVMNPQAKRAHRERRTANLAPRGACSGRQARRARRSNGQHDEQAARGIASSARRNARVP